MLRTYSYPSDFGPVRLAEEDGALVFVHVGEKESPPPNAQSQEQETPLLREAMRQLQEYFAGQRKVFELPLAPRGTAFQLRVWQALRDIPHGETRSYGDIAKAVGNPGASRAVGAANNKNPLWVIVPCHRVIGAKGALVGYGGGLPLKQRLLDLEKRI